MLLILSNSLIKISFKKYFFIYSNDGKQTPNTTVNNITKDFAAFTTCNEETIKNSTSTPLKSGANEG